MVFAAESQGGTSFKAMSLEMSVSMPRPASTGFPVFWGQETHLIILDPRAGPQMLQDDKVKKGQGIDHFPPDHIYIYIYSGKDSNQHDVEDDEHSCAVRKNVPEGFDSLGCHPPSLHVLQALLT